MLNVMVKNQLYLRRHDYLPVTYAAENISILVKFQPPIFQIAYV